ncbi:HEAT domain-containing protein [Calothrix sp. NIES-4071]|nr:HEAT domain-containing protein [Calothrix sp. NIES-4071]BAZ62500.1 HEAT domain-containing protein [Calothrix sp. NIES-4105]
MTNNIAQLISAVEQADSSASLLEAVQNLASSRLEEAVPTLIAALGYNNPGAAVAAVDGLIAIGSKAVEPLLSLLDNYNYGARAWAVRALAGIGDPRGFDILLDAAENDFALSVRRAAARGLGTIHWQLLPSEQVLTKQQQAIETLIQVAKDPEWVVRYAAVTGLEALAGAISETQPEILPQITAPLLEIANNDEEVAIRARAWMAINQQQNENNAIEMPNIKTLAESDDEKQVPSRGSSRRT